MAFVDWINASDPFDPSLSISMDMANQERTVYLISDDDAENHQRWIALNYQELFESELAGWYNDESLWPQKRTKKLFNQWFAVEFHSVLIDTHDGPLFDDGA